jgi:hypothetical protein
MSAGRRGDQNHLLVGAFLCLACHSLIAAPPVPPEVVLALDNSGSMRKNDPNSLMRSAARDFAHRLGTRARLGIVLFDTRATVILRIKATDAPDFDSSLDASLARIDYRGRFTDIPAGIERALYELRTDGTPGAPKMVVLFTDGIVDTGDPSKDAERSHWLREDLTQEARRQGIRITGIAFTEDADFALIQSVAGSAGGEYYRVLEARDIPATFAAIARAIVNLSSEPSVIKDKHPQEDGGRHEVPSPIRTTIVVIGVVLGTAALLGGTMWFASRLRSRLPMEASFTDLLDPTRVYRLRRKTSYIGRDKRCDVVLPYNSIGFRHASIEFRDDHRFHLRDLRSTNGTWVNGTRLAAGGPVAEEIVRAGDLVRFHKYTLIFVAAEDGTVVEAGTEIPRCVHHPSIPALEYCEGCGNMFCDRCIQTVGEKALCAGCASKQRGVAAT